MKKGVIIALFLLLLVACAPTEKEEVQPTDFRFGTQGLYMEFVQNMPPPRLFDNEKLMVMLKLENKGTSDLTPASGKLYVSGFDTNIMSFAESVAGESGTIRNIPNLKGRGPFMPEGGIDTVTFSSGITPLSGATGGRIDKYTPTILATACYKYSTIASAQVCIDPNPFAPTRVERVCTAASVSLGSQGAPIAVTSVDVKPSPGLTRFSINIQNVGGGTVFKPNTDVFEDCSPYSGGLAFADVDYIKVTGVELSGANIIQTCKPLSDQLLRLNNGQATLYCESSGITQQSAYLAPLNINLEYGYRQSVSKPIEIRATGQAQTS